MAEFRCRSENSDYTILAVPHRVVWAAFHSMAVPRLKQVLHTPRKFDTRKPCGCARAPCAPATKQRSVQEGAGSGQREGKEDVAGASWKSLIECVEIGLCGVLGLYRGGAPDRRWRGRGEEGGIVKRPVLPQRASGPQGRLNQEEYGNVWLLHRLQELLCISRRERAGAEDCPERSKQWDKLVRKVCSPSAPIAIRQEQRMQEISRVLQACMDKPARAFEQLAVTVNWVKALAKKAQVRRDKQAKVSWEKWTRQQAKNGGEGGMLFSLVKRAKEDPEIAPKCMSSPSLRAEDVVAEDFKQWDALWQKLRDVAQAPWREEGARAEEREEPRAKLDCLVLRRAARTFKPKTATGIDTISPSLFAWLSDTLLQCIAEYLEWLEDEGIWPAQLKEALVHLIPKSSGGRRPIGILPALVRLWERARRSEMEVWRATAVREYNWMRHGRGAERSVWAQTVYEEAARARGQATASIMIDEVQAFEQVALNIMWTERLKMKMHRWILKLALEACAFGRRLTYKGAVSSVSHTLSAVLAGSGFAGDLLLVTIITGVDEIMKRSEACNTRCVTRGFVIMDDVRLVIEGPENKVGKGIAKIVEDVFEVFEEQLHMEISRDKEGAEGKTVAQASHRHLERRIGSAIGRFGIRVKRKVRNLGVDFEVSERGGSRRRQVLRARVKEGTRRMRRAAFVGGGGRRRVIRAMVVPSVTYGSAAQSLPRTDERFLRTEMAKTYGTIRGRSTTARPLVERADPTLIIIEKAVMTWVCAAWD